MIVIYSKNDFFHDISNTQAKVKFLSCLSIHRLNIMQEPATQKYIIFVWRVCSHIISSPCVSKPHLMPQVCYKHYLKLDYMDSLYGFCERSYTYLHSNIKPNDILIFLGWASFSWRRGEWRVPGALGRNSKILFSYIQPTHPSILPLSILGQHLLILFSPSRSFLLIDFNALI